jgi:hypothetical protein
MSSPTSLIGSLTFIFRNVCVRCVRAPNVDMQRSCSGTMPPEHGPAHLPVFTAARCVSPPRGSPSCRHGGDSGGLPTPHQGLPPRYQRLAACHAGDAGDQCRSASPDRSCRPRRVRHGPPALDRGRELRTDTPLSAPERDGATGTPDRSSAVGPGTICPRRPGRRPSRGERPQGAALRRVPDGGRGGRRVLRRMRRTPAR